MAKSVTVPLFKDTVPIHYYTSVQTKELHEDYYQHFYSKLNYNQSLHRIILQRSTQKMLRLGQWSRVDLCLVNEMGLPSCQDTETNIHVQLACKLIIRRHRTYIDSPLYEVGMQPLHDDAWGDNQRSQQSSIGFIKSNHGGFEYCIRRNAAADSNQPLGDVYLYISQAPSGPSSVTCNVLPLVIGPLIVDEEEIIYQDTCKAPVSMWSDVVSKRVAHPVVKSVRNGFWDQKQETSRTYRVYPILSGLKHHQEQYFLMEENWKSGMPGKIWDGALVITDIFAKRLAKNPTFLDNAHVLDLSAGLGCFGVILSAIYCEMQRRLSSIHQFTTPPLITLTDLQEALPLIRHNYLLNMPPQYLHQSDHSSRDASKDRPFVSIMPLRWGFQCDAQKFIGSKPIDYLIASDVLYDASKTSALAHTLIHLSTPDVTVVYLVYKRRALKREEEEAFFDECRQYFDISVMPACSNTLDTSLCRDEISVDGSTWLSQGLESTSTASHSQQTGVIVYELKRK